MFSFKMRMALWGCILVLLGGGVAWLWYVMMPLSPVGVPMVVGHAISSSGVEVMLTQYFTGRVEPYVVSLFVRPPNESWLWYFVDDDAVYWRGAVSIDEEANQATITKNGKVVAHLDLEGLRLVWVRERPGLVTQPLGVVKGHPLDPQSRVIEDLGDLGETERPMVRLW